MAESDSMGKNATTKRSKVQGPPSGWFPNHPAFARGRQADGIIEYTLKSNGLTVLLHIDREAPTAGVMVTYAVGSRNEGKGHTGAAHLLEHMMFKGSEHFNKKKGNDAWQLLERVGGRINATTWLDRTNYFEVVPKEHLETAIAFEADRMRRAILTAKDFTTEKTVVLNELERAENEPMELLDVELWKRAFTAHPYHHPTIGWREDVEAMTVETLRDFYDTYYYPDNAVLSVFGDIEPKAVLDEVNRHYGALPSSTRTIVQSFAPEPAQEAARHVDVERPGSLNIVAVGYRVPPALHEDTPALHLLTQALGVGKRSRLHLALVEKNLATEVVVFHFPFRDENLLVAYAFLEPGVTHEAARDAMISEFERIGKKGVTNAEHAAAKAKAVSEIAFSRDGVYATLQSVGNAIAIGDWAWYVDFPVEVASCETDALAKAATRYFTETNRMTGYFKGVASKAVKRKAAASKRSKKK